MPQASARLSPRLPEGSSCGYLIPLDDALAASSLEIITEFVGLVRGAERADLGAIERSLPAHIRTSDHCAAVLQLIRKLGLQGLVGRLGVSLALLRRNLDHKAPRNRRLCRRLNIGRDGSRAH